MTAHTSKPRGLAALPLEERQRIARKGGQAAHRLGVAHEFSSEEARAAGRKGGQVATRKREQARIQAQGRSAIPPEPTDG